MPKPKQHSKPSKVSRIASKQEPEDENDFLEAADELEKAGGKWRAGDAEKATRFFTRAIQMYDNGIQKFPKSFDLSYNKARLLYDICEDPRTSPLFRNDLTTLLREALSAHRATLQLNNENPDILFNTAQVLTSLSESIGESDNLHEDEQVKLVQEAIELFSSCLSRQELDYSENESMMRQSDEQTKENESTRGDDTNEPRNDSTMDSDSSSQPSQWATVVEPTTASTLLDTALATLAALSTLCSLQSSNAGALSTISSIASPLVTDRIPSYIARIPIEAPEAPPSGAPASLSITATSSAFTSQARAAIEANPQAAAQIEAKTGVASFTASFSDAEYRGNQIPASTYFERVKNEYETLLSLARSAEGLAAYADALIEFNSAVAQQMDSGQTQNLAETVEHRWHALTVAKDLLLGASKIQGSPNDLMISLYSSLGDVYLYRFRIATLGASITGIPESIMKSSPAQSAQTAAVYYRGANSYAKKAGEHKTEERDEAGVKALVAEVLRYEVAGNGGENEWIQLKSSGVEKVGDVLKDMVDDGLLLETEANGLLRKL